jgi:transposase-like protein
MTTLYSQKRKEQVLKWLLPPESQSVSAVHKMTGIPCSTLHTWKAQMLNQKAVSMPKETSTQRWSLAQKLDIIIESATLSQTELADYCRKKGLYVESLAEWKQAFLEPEQPNEALRKDLQAEKQRAQRLEKELKRKDKALAETAALLVLQKKAQLIWGEDGES